MNLKLVTFNTDQEQFLVCDAETDIDAILAAVRANRMIGGFGVEEWDKEVDDTDLYEIEDVDYKLLYEMFRHRNDCLFLYDNVIVFSD